MEAMDHHHPDQKGTFCVTGAGGYMGSWLVRSLLQKGYKVHAASRDPEKASEIISFDDEGRLKIFKADMIEQGSYDAAVQGCNGVFHVAEPMEFAAPNGQNPDSYLKTNVHKIASSGTLNVLEAAWKAKSVKRVVFTSSLSTISARNNGENIKAAMVDESCLNSIDAVIKSRAYGWVYVASELVADQTAWRFAKEKELDMVSLVPALAGGVPFLTPTVPPTLQVLLSPITGNEDLYPILCAVNSRLGSIPVAHIEDICSAQIFLMEKKEAKGRYICSAQSCSLPQLLDFYSLQCPSLPKRELPDELNGWEPTTVSSNRLKELGFEFKRGLEDTLKESIDCCVECGFLKTSIPVAYKKESGHAIADGAV